MHKDQFRVHDVARIRTGKYAGLVGVVTEVDVPGGRVRVQIQGVRNGEGVNVHLWLKRSAVERNHGGQA